jgi:hypothetical protein
MGGKERKEGKKRKVKETEHKQQPRKDIDDPGGK